MPRSELSKCPICGAATDREYKPFCSEQCKFLDLAKWIGVDEPYVVSGDGKYPAYGNADVSDVNNKVIHVDFAGRRRSA